MEKMIVKGRRKKCIYVTSICTLSPQWKTSAFGNIAVNRFAFHVSFLRFFFFFSYFLLNLKILPFHIAIWAVV